MKQLELEIPDKATICLIAKISKYNLFLEILPFRSQLHIQKHFSKKIHF